MTLQTKIYIGLAVAAIFAIGIIGVTAWSNHRISTLDGAVEAAKKKTETAEKLADQREIEAAGYRHKIEFLESQLTEIQTIARKQDEELEKHFTNTRNARADVERAKRIRTIDANAAELCRKLAELGHGCG